MPLDPKQIELFDILFAKRHSEIMQRAAEQFRLSDHREPTGLPSVYKALTKQFAQEIADAKIDAYIETVTKLDIIPDTDDFHTLAQSIQELALKAMNTFDHQMKQPFIKHDDLWKSNMRSLVASEIEQIVGRAVPRLKYFIDERSLVHEIKPPSWVLSKESSSRNPNEWDPLVGMLRKEVFEREIDSKTALAIEANDSLALLFIDVDDFKKVNTDLGHPVGDKVLRQVAEIVTRIVGNRGDCYRNGGEEFCVLLHNHTPIEAFLLANRIREGVSKEPISEDALSITVSIGLAEIPSHAHTSEELLKLANDAMREAKDSGKDCVVSFGGEEITSSTQNPTKPRNTKQKVLTAPIPDVRVSFSMAVLAGTASIPSTAVSVKVENHSPVPVFITSVYFLADNDQCVLVPKDVLGQSLITERELNAGKAITFLIDPTQIKEFLHLGINNIGVRDAIGREYSGDEELVRRTLQALQ